jgi:hypothetical protein
MNAWVRKNRTNFYRILEGVERQHLKGYTFDGDLNLNEIYILLSELYKEVDTVEANKDLALADLAVAKQKIKELESELGKLGNTVAQKA